MIKVCARPLFFLKQRASLIQCSEIIFVTFGLTNDLGWIILIL